MKWRDEDAERLLIERNPVAHAAAMARDPEYRTIEDSPLPDRLYAHAARQVRTGVWTQDEANRHLAAEIHERAMRRISGDLRTHKANALRHGALPSRLDAAFMQCIKDFAIVGVPSVALMWLAPGASILAYIGLAYVAMSVVIAFASRAVG